jgi:hypothetical protein
MDKDLIVPGVNLNGTSHKELMLQYTAALTFLSNAMANLPRPHGRDYQTMPDGSYRAAEKQFRDWYQRLETVRLEVEQVALAVSVQRPRG